MFGCQAKKFNLSHAIIIPMKIVPFCTILRLLFTILNGLVPMFMILATSNFINTVISFNKGGKHFIDYTSIIYLLAVVSWSILQPSIFNLIDIRFLNMARKNLIMEFTKKRASLKYHYIEDDETLNLIIRVSSKAEQTFLEMFKIICLAISYLISILSIIYLIFFISPVICFLLIIISIPTCYFAIKAGKKRYKLKRETYNVKRKYEYLSEILKGRETLFERTIFGYSNKINSEFMKKFKEVYKLELNLVRKNFIRIKSIGVAVSLVAVFSIFSMINDTINKIISIGLFIALVNGLIQLASTLSWNIPNILDNITGFKEYFKDLTQFANLDEEHCSSTVSMNDERAFEKLEFKNVSFRYPNCEEYILRGMTFIIRKNKTYAFVGINGCGKTTITKLILGLFDEYEGEILLNGKSIKLLQPNEIRSYFCGVFQDYAKYSISLEENILIANPNSTINEIEKAISLCGLDEDVKSMPYGIKTNLGKITDNSVDLSGGQWQRLAIARSAISNSPVKILDEPTSALDPIAESEVYDTFKNISDGCTTILISHRLGSTQFADTIYVVDNGKIAEEGSHIKLMSLDGIYSKMFKSQRSWYI